LACFLHFYLEGDIPTKVGKTPRLLATGTVSEAIGPEEWGILFLAIANGSVVSWQHINLLGEYDFSDEKLQDSVGIKPPKLAA
jgi:hypothetical protein